VTQQRQRLNAPLPKRFNRTIRRESGYCRRMASRALNHVDSCLTRCVFDSTESGDSKADATGQLICVWYSLRVVKIAHCSVHKLDRAAVVLVVPELAQNRKSITPGHKSSM
jgi:hypothetical protein